MNGTSKNQPKDDALELVSWRFYNRRWIRQGAVPAMPTRCLH